MGIISFLGSRDLNLGLHVLSPTPGKEAVKREGRAQAKGTYGTGSKSGSNLGNAT